MEGGRWYRDVEDSVREMTGFIESHEQWVIEGCYGSLVEVAARHATELRFLEPGVEECVRRIRGRAWEPDKFASEEEQLAMRDYLIEWVREYEDREDEFGLACHRRIFEAFDGEKREHC